MIRMILTIPCFIIAIIVSIFLMLLLPISIVTAAIWSVVILPLAYLKGEERDALTFLGGVMMCPIEMIYHIWK